MSEQQPVPKTRGEPMRCPSCSARLVEVERSEVMIDACPECRGVWLDRGELDRILAKERQIAAGVTDPDEDFFGEVEGRRGERRPPAHYQRQDEGEHWKKKRKRSFLEELFDN